jgi:LAO/AO transport system kinase
MEITDIFVVNKMDLPGADRKVAEITQMLELNKNFIYKSQSLDDKLAERQRWTPQIIKVNSISGENFEELLKIIEVHKNFLNSTGFIDNYQKNRIKMETLQILKHKLTQKIKDLVNNSEKIEPILEEVMNKSLDPYSMAEKIIKMLGIEKE